jgi:hypothetical protein
MSRSSRAKSRDVRQTKRLWHVPRLRSARTDIGVDGSRGDMPSSRIVEAMRRTRDPFKPLPEREGFGVGRAPDRGRAAQGRTHPRLLPFREGSYLVHTHESRQRIAPWRLGCPVGTGVERAERPPQCVSASGSWRTPAPAHRQRPRWSRPIRCCACYVLMVGSQDNVGGEGDRRCPAVICLICATKDYYKCR